MKIVQENTGKKRKQNSIRKKREQETAGKISVRKKLYKKQPHRSEKQICAAVSQILWN